MGIPFKNYHLYKRLKQGEFGVLTKDFEDASRRLNEEAQAALEAIRDEAEKAASDARKLVDGEPGTALSDGTVLENSAMSLVTAGSAATPHLYYTFPDAPEVEVTEAWQEIDLTGAVAVVSAGDAALFIDTDSESGTYGKVLDPSGRTGVLRLAFVTDADTPEESDEAEDAAELDLQLSLSISARKARNLVRKKRREGDAFPRPIIEVETNIGDPIGRVHGQSFLCGWGETPHIFHPPSFGGETWQANGGWFRFRFSPDPTVAAHPPTRLRLVDLATFNL